LIPTMKLAFKKFQQAYYPEYAAWFVDPELNRRLGPMDQEWLHAVLAEPEAEGITWAVFRDDELVAVIETVFDPDDQRSAVIMATAVKPTLRRQGLGTAVLQRLLAMHQTKSIDAHLAYVAQDNESARRLIEQVGFVQTTVEPDEHGYLEFQCNYSVQERG